MQPFFFVKAKSFQPKGERWTGMIACQSLLIRFFCHDFSPHSGHFI